MKQYLAQHWANNYMVTAKHTSIKQASRANVRAASCTSTSCPELPRTFSAKARLDGVANVVSTNILQIKILLDSNKTTAQSVLVISNVQPYFRKTFSAELYFHFAIQIVNQIGRFRTYNMRDSSMSSLA